MKNANIENGNVAWSGITKVLSLEKTLLLIKQVSNTNWLIISLLLGIALIVPGQLLSSLTFTMESALSIGPFLLVSVGVAAYMKATGADQVIGKIFSGRPVMMIFAAAIFGAISPFCSCGVIPLIAALLASGVPLSAVMAFWISSPVMSPDMFILTAGELGLEFATAKTLAAIAVGLLGGFTVYSLQYAGVFSNPLRSNKVSSCGVSRIKNGAKPVWKFWQESDRIDAFKKEFSKTAIFLGQWLLFAFLLESLMVVYLPAEKIGQWIATDSLAIIPFAAIIGVPTYLNGFAAIPVAAGLLESGFQAGAVLSFMTAGAMTSIPAAIAVYSLVKKNVFFLYMSLSLVGAMLVGFTYQAYTTMGI